MSNPDFTASTAELLILDGGWAVRARGTVLRRFPATDFMDAVAFLDGVRRHPSVRSRP